MEPDDPDPLFTSFLKDAGLEYLSPDERAALRQYLSSLGRKWAEMEACQAVDAMKADPSRGLSVADVRASMAAEHKQATSSHEQDDQAFIDSVSALLLEDLEHPYED